jgi:hypothetical protein
MSVDDYSIEEINDETEDMIIQDCYDDNTNQKIGDQT